MTRTEYLTQLELYLKKLPEADRIEAMDYFRELFDDAGIEGEEELIASLGTPKEAAHEVLSNLLDKKINEAPAQKNNRQILHIALLALLAAPIGIPLGNRHPRDPVRNPCSRFDCHSGFLCSFHTGYHRRIPIFS
ncbi:membrane protein [Streptococcus pneumoniae]|nr:membrane protein [Streptococcus pneumoniae]